VNQNEILTMIVFDSTGTEALDIAPCVSTSFQFACGVLTAVLQQQYWFNYAVHPLIMANTTHLQTVNLGKFFYTETLTHNFYFDI
jgi:hypothetical protein